MASAVHKTAEPGMEGKQPVILSDGKQGAQKEQSMTLWQAVQLYPKAVGWSILFSSTLIMEGYHLALLGSMYASPAFKKKFGVQSQFGKRAVPAAWHRGFPTVRAAVKSSACL